MNMIELRADESEEIHNNGTDIKIVKTNCFQAEFSKFNLKFQSKKLTLLSLRSSEKQKTFQMLRLSYFNKKNRYTSENS